MGESKSGLQKHLTIKEVAEHLGCSVRHLHDEIKKKNLRAYKPGKELLFYPEDIEKWIRRKAVS